MACLSQDYIIWLKDVLISVVLANMYLATASGSFLNLFAWGVNLSRKAATAASGVIRFYKSDAAQAVVIPAGTLIQTERINGTIFSVAVSADNPKIDDALTLQVIGAVVCHRYFCVEPVGKFHFVTDERHLFFGFVQAEM